MTHDPTNPFQDRNELGDHLRTTKLDHDDACPFCNRHLDAATAGPHNPDATPDPNDATICVHCGSVLIFDENLRVRPPTPKELAEVMADPGAVNMIETIAKLHKTGHT